MLSRYRKRLSWLFICIVSFVLYVKLWDELKVEPGYRIEKERPVENNEKRTQRTMWTNKSAQNVEFTYSTKELFNTILGIRRTNCDLTNQGNDLFCQRIIGTECNTTRHTAQVKPNDCDQRLPKALVIGVAKCGTREVLDFLMMNHLVTIKQEPYLGSYFNKQTYEKGIDWYRGQMPFSLSDQLTMEKGNYFHDPLAPGRIHAMDPNIKLLLMIRDPVDRLISGSTFLSSVEETLAKLEKYMNNPDGKAPSLSKLRYDEAFERYLQYFDREQIHVVDSERFKKYPIGTLKYIETFLGLPHVIRREDFVFNEFTGSFCLRAVGREHAVCLSEDRGLNGNGDRFEKYKAPLRRYFKQYNERFFELLGRRLDWPQ